METYKDMSLYLSNKKVENIMDKVYCDLEGKMYKKRGLIGIEKTVKSIEGLSMSFNITTTPFSINAIAEAVSETFLESDFTTKIKKLKNKRLVGALKKNEFYGSVITSISSNKILKQENYCIEIKKI